MVARSSSNSEKYTGNGERYQTTRDSAYDMQRDIHATFEPIPTPIKVNTNDLEKSGYWSMRTAGYGGEKSLDPLIDHLRGIRDDTPTNKEN